LGRHAFVNTVIADVNANTPFESAWADVKDVPYCKTGNGSVIGVIQSSQELPISVVAAVTVPG